MYAYDDDDGGSPADPVDPRIRSFVQQQLHLLDLEHQEEEAEALKVNESTVARAVADKIAITGLQVASCRFESFRGRVVVFKAK